MRGLMLGMLVLVGVVMAQPAQAGIKDTAAWKWSANIVRYAWEPVNCPVQYINKNISAHASERGDLGDLGACIVDNINRNPATLNTLVQ